MYLSEQNATRNIIAHPGTNPSGLWWNPHFFEDGWKHSHHLPGGEIKALSHFQLSGSPDTDHT